MVFTTHNPSDEASELAANISTQPLDEATQSNPSSEIQASCAEFVAVGDVPVSSLVIEPALIEPVAEAEAEAEAEVSAVERARWVPPEGYVPSPFAIPRDGHSLSRKHISKNALSVLYKLHDAGYRALLVGGGVRDVLLGRSPKDFDVATDATPEQVRKLFRNCRLIGRRFRLAHVLFGRDVVEVATFRAAGDDVPGRQADDSGRLLRDNVYGTIEDDVQRRDFTVNALYYDIADFSVLDHVGGMQDLRDGVLRLLGDPETRYREDPVRMLRAARFAAKLGFKLHESTEQPIAALSSLLAGIPPARLFDECLKLFHTGHGAASLNELVRLDLLRWLLPPLHQALAAVEDDGAAWAFLYAALSNTDKRVAEGLPLSSAFLFAALLWPVVVMHAQAHAHAGQPEAMLLQQAGDEVLHLMQPHVAIPRHLQLLVREVWEMQARFVVHQGRGVASLHGHPRFRAAYDFLLLRAQVGEPQAVEDAAWWTAFVESGADDAPGVGGGDKGRGNRRRSSRRRKGAVEALGGGVEHAGGEVMTEDAAVDDSLAYDEDVAETSEPEVAARDEALEAYPAAPVSDLPSAPSEDENPHEGHVPVDVATDMVAVSSAETDHVAESPMPTDTAQAAIHTQSIEGESSPVV